VELGRRTKQETAGRAQSRQAKAELTLAERQLLANVRSFHREADVARDQVASLRESLDLSTESLRLTLLRYQSGEASVLDVVDAQTTLTRRVTRTTMDWFATGWRSPTLQTLTGTL